MYASDINQIRKESKEPGLYIVSTPIGNMADITIRALRVLKTADIIFCEDTRETKKILHNYGIQAELDSYNDHNAGKKRELILEMLKAGKMVALVSDAGTPLVSDPGYKLVREAADSGHRIVPLPGPSSILAALVKSGMPSDNFMFCGFADSKKFNKYTQIDATLIFFESAKRLVETLKDMDKNFKGREVAVARELTKVFEESRKGSFEDVISFYEKTPPRGEIVILLSPPAAREIDEEQIKLDLKQILRKVKLKEASEMLGEKYGISKKQVYELGLELKKE